MAGHAYVEYQIPKEQTHPFPIVMIHGCCPSGSGWTGTPDGRDGWAQYFLSKGYATAWRRFRKGTGASATSSSRTASWWRLRSWITTGLRRT